MKTVGVLALQGAVSEHLQMLSSLQVKGLAVKHVEDLQQIDALIIPGGESTAISRLIQQHGLYQSIQQFALTHPVMGTCAGLILCGKQIIQSDHKVLPLGLIDIEVERNGFGRQVDSFETHFDIAGIGNQIPAVFIRAPYINSIAADIKVLATVDDKIVMAEQGHILVMAFHPELTSDTRVLQYFIEKIPH